MQRVRETPSPLASDIILPKHVHKCICIHLRHHVPSPSPRAQLPSPAESVLASTVTAYAVWTCLPGASGTVPCCLSTVDVVPKEDGILVLQMGGGTIPMQFSVLVRDYFRKHIIQFHIKQTGLPRLDSTPSSRTLLYVFLFFCFVFPSGAFEERNG